LQAVLQRFRPRRPPEDGFLFITDRKKDVVFVKGFNVFPREIEEVIHTYPKVDMVGVVGVPDAHSGGERLVAFVKPRNGEMLDGGEISTHCASRLAGYKCPTEVRAVGQLPLTGAQSWTASHRVVRPAASKSHRQAEPTRIDQGSLALQASNRPGPAGIEIKRADASHLSISGKRVFQ
jgi:hypothetical protein